MQEKYIPRLSKEDIEERRVGLNPIYESLCSVTKERRFKVLDKEIVAIPGMFAPIGVNTPLLAEAVRKEVKQSDIVLDMGTGSGVLALFAAEKAKKVTAVDINPKAVVCTKKNVKLFGLEKKFQVKYSDVFSNLKNEKFDLIIFNPPFRWFEPRDIIERSITDKDYRAIREFFDQVKKHLKSKGRILLAFSTSGDVSYLKHVIKHAGLEYKTIIKYQENPSKCNLVLKIQKKIKQS